MYAIIKKEGAKYWKELHYAPNMTHYFSGFAWEEYFLPLSEQWARIERAALIGISRGMQHVVIWAGTQIRRDSWSPKPVIEYIPNICNWVNVMPKEISQVPL